MAGGVELRGADQLISAAQQVAENLQDLSTTEAAVGELLVADASRNAPVRTGFLAASHGFEVVDATVAVVVAADYASYVHAQTPWLADTVAADESKVTELYAAGVEDAVAPMK